MMLQQIDKSFKKNNSFYNQPVNQKNPIVTRVFQEEQNALDLARNFEDESVIKQQMKKQKADQFLKSVQQKALILQKQKLKEIQDKKSFKEQKYQDKLNLSRSYTCTKDLKVQKQKKEEKILEKELQENLNQISQIQPQFQNEISEEPQQQLDDSMERDREAEMEDDEGFEFQERSMQKSIAQIVIVKEENSSDESEEEYEHPEQIIQNIQKIRSQLGKKFKQVQFI